MALNLGTAYSSIEVRLDNLEAGLAQAQRDFGNAGRRLESEADKIKRNLTQSFGELGRTLTIGLTAPLAALGTAAIRSAVDMDSLKRGLRAVAGSGEEMEKQLRRLKEVAKLPGLGFQEAIQGSINLQAAGLSARQAERALMGFGNALATVGKGKADLDGVTLALTQIAAKGKVSAEEINQLQERVPQIRQIMKDAFGTADTEILQKAKITSTQFIEAITAALEKIPKVTGGAQNAFENFSDTAKQTLAKIGDVFLPAVTRALDSINPIIEKIGDSFKALSPSMQTAFGGLAVGGAIIGPALVGLASLARAIANINTLLKGTPLAGLLGGGTAGAIAAPIALGGVLEATIGRLPEEGGMSPEVRKLAAAEIAKKNLDPATLRRRLAELDKQIASFNKNRKFYQENYGVSRFAELNQENIDRAREAMGIRLALQGKGTARPKPGAGTPKLNAEEMAKAEQARKDAIEKAKQAAAATTQAEIEILQNMGQKRKAVLAKTQEDYLNDLAVGVPEATALKKRETARKQQLDEIARDEAEQRKQIAEKRKRDAEKSLDEWIAYKYQEWKLAAAAEQKAQDFYQANAKRIADNATQAATERIDRQIAAEVEAMREAAQKRIDEMERQSEAYQAAVDLYSKQKPVGIDPNKPRAIPEADNPLTRPETKDQYAARIQRINNSLRRSLGGTLGMEIGYAFSDGFAQSIEKALGGGSVGKVIARAFARWMDKEITNLLDNLFDQLAKKKGAAGGAGAGGGGGIFGTILSGLGLGMALGGLFKGFKLKFAEGGIVPGPIGQPQPAIVHSGEVVLNQRQQAALLNGMGGGGMNLHIENAHFASDYDVDRMWDRLNWNMKNRRAVNPGVG